MSLLFLRLITRFEIKFYVNNQQRISNISMIVRLSNTGIGDMIKYNLYQHNGFLQRLAPNQYTKTYPIFVSKSQIRKITLEQYPLGILLSCYFTDFRQVIADRAVINCPVGNYLPKVGMIWK